jgi:hypothetical protein
MAAGTFRLPSGTKLRTQSNRRYVVVAEYVPGKPCIEYRTSDYSRAIARQSKIGLRALVVDTVRRRVLVRHRWDQPREWVEA